MYSLTVTLAIKDGATVVFTLETNATKGNQARSPRLAAEFGIDAAKAQLSGCTQGVKRRINGAIRATKGTAEIGLVFVNGVFHAHG